MNPYCSRKLMGLLLMVVLLISCRSDEILEEQPVNAQISSDLYESIEINADNWIAYNQQFDLFTWYNLYDNSLVTCNNEYERVSFFINHFDINNQLIFEPVFVTYNVHSNQTFNQLFQQSAILLEDSIGIEINNENPLVRVNYILIVNQLENGFRYLEIDSLNNYIDFFSDCTSNNVVWQFVESENNLPIFPPIVALDAGNTNNNLPLQPCIQFDFPISFLALNRTNHLTNTFTIEIQNYEQLKNLFSFEEITTQVLDFQYPVNIIKENQIFNTNNIEEISSLFLSDSCNL